jgi:hypothetical protein
MGNWYEALEAAAFKQVENGYVYSAPWIVRPSRYYLVNEAQKAAITERMVQVQKALIPVSLIFWLLVVGMIMFLANPDGSFSAARTTMFLLATIVPMIATIYLYRVHKLRPLLAGLPPTPPPTRERTTLRGMLGLAAERLPLSWLVGVGFLSGLWILMRALALAKTVHEIGPAEVLNLTSSALLMMLLFGLAWYKVTRA